MARTQTRMASSYGIRVIRVIKVWRYTWLIASLIRAIECFKYFRITYNLRFRSIEIKTSPGRNQGEALYLRAFGASEAMSMHLFKISQTISGNEVH